MASTLPPRPWWDLQPQWRDSSLLSHFWHCPGGRWAREGCNLSLSQIKWDLMNWSVSSIISMKIFISVSISSRSAATELRSNSMSSFSFWLVRLRLIMSSSSANKFLKTSRKTFHFSQRSERKSNCLLQIATQNWRVMPIDKWKVSLLTSSTFCSNSARLFFTASRRLKPFVSGFAST